MNENPFPRMHVSFYVSNLQNTIDFYSKFFNKPVDKVEPGYAKFILAEPSLVISFLENKSRVKENFGHLGIQVETPELLEEKKTLVASSGLSIKEELGTNCCYAQQDKFWVHDPDNIAWEVYYFHKDVAFNDPHYSKPTSACCAPEEAKTKQLEGDEKEACCEVESCGC
ncbi:ArsI/CadI family heavy metal resistance metalloenzyme [Fulvivirgaceae bacterium BMA10]|uniref:ArsI/CadI family heavy metal resistance metalloenzyme n=1 Tax=Splendidivirga corallicola TaxID=3051826 RepID=A0ABT8KJH9_9BACT|nr:ArsI/CadI family heavy metal resistance metalloenzyme [Fulvivirgaceae bacterium BMA10]